MVEMQAGERTREKDVDFGDNIAQIQKGCKWQEMKDEEGGVWAQVNNPNRNDLQPGCKNYY